MTTTFWEAMCSPVAMAETEGRAPHTGGPFMPKTGIPLVMLPKATGYREIIRFLDDRGTSLLKGKGDAQRELAAKL